MVVVHKSENLTDAERSVVERFDVVVVPATSCTSLIWMVAIDEKDRRYLQLRNNGDRRQCFVELIQSELERMDPNQLERVIVGCDRPCTQNRAT